MTIRIPIDSRQFSVWACAHESNPYEDRPLFHTLGIAWDLSKNRNLFLDELTGSAWEKLLKTSADVVYIKNAATRKYTAVNRGLCPPSKNE